MGNCERGVFRGDREPFWLASGRWWQQWEIYWPDGIRSQLVS